MSDQNGNGHSEDYDGQPVKVRFPPGEDEGIGKCIPVACEKCGLAVDIYVSRRVESPKSGYWAKCPCGGKMFFDFNGLNITAKVRGPGVSSSKYGMRRARELTKKNEELAKSQWDNHEPISVINPERIRNPTQGGPYDPNGPFQPKKREKKVFTPPSSGS